MWTGRQDQSDRTLPIILRYFLNKFGKRGLKPTPQTACSSVSPERQAIKKHALRHFIHEGSRYKVMAIASLQLFLIQYGGRLPEIATVLHNYNIQNSRCMRGKNQTLKGKQEVFEVAHSNRTDVDADAVRCSSTHNIQYGGHKAGSIRHSYFMIGFKCTKLQFARTVNWTSALSAS